MDDEFQNLEAELQRLRPRAPSRELAARIERELAASPGFDAAAAAPIPFPAPAAAPGQVRPAPRLWLAIALPIAAALAVGLFLASPPRAVPSSEPVAALMAPADPDLRPASGDLLKPVAAENILLAARDEGLVTLADGSPARQERLQYVDTITWKNLRTNASLTWSVPREEVRIVPVVFQ